MSAQLERKLSGTAKIKFFKLATADPTDFVRKEGDTMTGDLQVR